MTTRPRWFAYAALALLCACSPTEVEPGPPRGLDAPTVDDSDPQLLLDFEAGVAVDGTWLATTGQPVRVVTHSQGEVTSARDPSGGRAARFPSVEDAAAGNLASLVVTDVDEAIVPKDEDFTFGVDVMLPAAATQTRRDDGDNLVQRGLYGAGGQFKLQLDDGRPSCRVEGELGEAFVHVGFDLEVGQWYRLRCEKSRQRLSLFVSELEGSEPTLWQEESAWAVIGSVTSRAPLSVGGKVNAEESPVLDSPDQFNGVLDNVIVQVAGSDTP